MTVSFVGSASAEATSLTLPAHQAGDLIVLFVLRNGSITPITPPAGWLVAGTAAFAVSAGLQTVFKIAASSAETSGTWASASLMGCVVYRHTTSYLILSAPSGSRSAAGGSTTVNFGQKAGYTAATVPGSVSDRMFQPTGWVGAVAATTSGTVTTGGAPTGMTSRLSATGASANGIYSFDSNAAIASFNITTTTAASAIVTVTHTFEIIDSGILKASSGGIQIARGMFGGMRG